MVLCKEVTSLAARALHDLELKLIILARLVLLALLVLLFLVGTLGNVLGRVVKLLVVHSIIQLTVVVELVLSVNLTTQPAQPQDQCFFHHHRLYSLFEYLNLLALRRIEGRQDDRFLRAVLHGIVDRVDVVLREAVDRLLVLVAIVPAWVVVRVLLLDQLSFVLVEQL